MSVIFNHSEASSHFCLYLFLKCLVISAVRFIDPAKSALQLSSSSAKLLLVSSLRFNLVNTVESPKQLRGRVDSSFTFLSSIV